MAEYIDLLQLDVARNKKYRMDAEVFGALGDAGGHILKFKEVALVGTFIVETLANLFCFLVGNWGFRWLTSGNAWSLRGRKLSRPTKQQGEYQEK